MREELLKSLKCAPVIAAVRDKMFGAALESPAKVIFLLGGNIMNIGERISEAHSKNKLIFIHIDLSEGIGKDKMGVEYLAKLGVDGIISTKAGIIRIAKEKGLMTVERFFAYDSHGVEGIPDMAAAAAPDFIEIMPGVIGKIVKRFSSTGIPLIAGGLIENEAEVKAALNNGAVAVSTGKKELWR
ncbi:MAG: glycerol-3-phosphate responsive antiterminator [Clostridia bacterium]|nr:glycerol-3-phosphate responsive antiterminator [Clostridia bacterium]